MSSNFTQDYFDNEQDYHRYLHQKLKFRIQNESNFSEEYQKIINAEYSSISNELTQLYYDLVSDMLQNSLEISYNGALIIDLDTQPETFIEQDVKNIIKYSNIEDESRVLECGCGYGYFFKRFLKEKPNVQYSGIDLSSSQIANAKKLNPDHADLFVQGDWSNLPYEDNSFDSILFLETIGYTTDVDKLLSECYRVLKPGGTLFSKHPGCLIEEYHSLTEIDENIKTLNHEYGYAKNSLGMMMNVPYFIRKLNEYSFNVPYGAISPPRDESFYIKMHFIEEIHSCFELVKVGNSFVSARYPEGNAHKFWEKVYEINPNHDHNSVLSALGKMHPKLVEFFRRTTFIEKHGDDEYSTYRSGQKIMSPCVIVTAIKE